MNRTDFTIINADSSKTISLISAGLNNGFNRITNVAAGIEFTDAATVGQLALR